jgi:Protein of unknown function (DUF3261)
MTNTTRTNTTRTNKRTSIGAALFLALSLLALHCGPSLPPAGAPAGALADYPGVLMPPSALSPNFSVRQKVAITYKDRSGGFEAVLQKQGDQLLVVGLGPLGVRTFVLEQRGSEISFKQNFGPPLPFPPRNIVLDVQRAWFQHRTPLPADAEVQPDADGIVRLSAVQDGERIDEAWKAGNLIERSFWRPATHQGAVRVRYQGACSRQKCQPERLVLTNEWYGYKLNIENQDYVFFDDRPVQ